MSSDRKDPTISGQNTTNQSAQWAPPVGQSNAEEPPAPLQQRQADASYPSMPDYAPNDQADFANAADPSGSAASPITLLQQLGQYGALILVPLLFGFLAALFVLPRISSGQAVLPPVSFLPILLVIIVITTAQAVAVYYAGSDIGLQLSGTLAGLFLLLLLACFTVYGLVPGLFLLIALIILGVVITRYSFHPVPEGYVDIAFLFKKYNRTLYPGFNILLPWEKVQTHLNVEEVQWFSPPQVVQLSRDEDVMLRGVISYQLFPEDAHLAVTQVQNWQGSLRTLFQTTLQHVATSFQPDDFLPWPQGHHTTNNAADADDFTDEPARREQINQFLFQSMRDKAALWGIQVNWTHVRDIELAPHGTFAVPSASAPVFIPSPVQTISQPADSPHEDTIAEIEIPEAARVPVAAHTASKQIEKQTIQLPPSPTPPPTHAPVSEAAPIQPTHPVNEQILIRAYKEIQDGKITDPDTIRSIAYQFDTIAKDPEASQQVNFDAAHAALNLYEQARKYEEQYQAMVEHNVNELDWLPHRTDDENLTAGG